MGNKHKLSKEDTEELVQAADACLDLLRDKMEQLNKRIHKIERYEKVFSILFWVATGCLVVAWLFAG